MPPFVYINLVGADSRSSNGDRSRSRSRVKSEDVKGAKSDDVYVILILFAYRL